ncbi:MAG: glycosyltransferase family 4 protein [Bacteroidota bacterium]
MALLVLEQELIDYRIPVYEKISKEIEQKVIIYYWESRSNTHHNILSDDEVAVETKRIKVLNLFGKIFFPNYFYKDIVDSLNTIVVRGNVRNAFLIPLIFINKMLGVKTILWGQAISRRRIFRPFRNIVDLFYLFILKICDSYILYDSKTKKILSNYIKKEKLFVANNTINTDKEFLFLKKLESLDRQRIKNDIGINTDISLCFIGRLTKRKKIDYLLEVFYAVEKQYDSIGLYIIGDGPQYEKVVEKIKKLNLTNVKLIGSMYGFEAAKYLYGCDIMIMPGWLGLAVNHALIYGLPIVSQKKDEYLTGHAPESVHLKHKYNGWFARYNDKEDMVKGVKEIISNYDFYSSNATKYAKENLKIERMVEGFTQAYEYVYES